MEPKICASCRGTSFEVGGFGIDVCMTCGLGTAGVIADHNPYVLRDRIVSQTTYTRRKRFKKYLLRANRSQSANTVPCETWAYLIERGPYQNPGQIHRTLKVAKHLKRKCYDSLPLLCMHLCDGLKVPRLSDMDILNSMRLFAVIDRRLDRDSMISYLFCLEYILKKIGREDMLPFISRIKCARRRAHYKERLDRMFSEDKRSVVDLMHSTVPL